MLWIKKFEKKILLFPLFFCASFVFLGSCGDKISPESRQDQPISLNWDTKINLGLGQSWFDLKEKDPNRISKFLENLTLEFNNLQQKNPETKNLPPVSFSFIGNDDSKTKIIQLLSSDNSENALDFSIADATTTIEDDPEKKLYNGLQTLTWSFKNSSNEPKFYQNGLDDDPLRQSAKKLDLLFNEISYNNWSNLASGAQKWDGIAYRFFYDESVPKKLISYYRGMILIAGNQEKLAKIRDAWEQKNWEKFRNYGIIHGKQTSAGRWKMQADLIKKHFGKNFFFASLSEDLLENPDKFIQKVDGVSIGQDKNFSISFDDEASFAWTKNTGNKKQFYPTEKDGKIEVFILTNPSSYDIGSFRPGFNRVQADMLVEAFINLAKNGKDTYGPNVGYNGYRHVDQKDPEFRRIHEQK
ncbi:ABC transporter thiamine pyrophosphate-binding lipoprotein p37/Cypl [Mycoplasma sp. 'Moose RK']|uniref:ABC transporter thiamine pyrophosphate-binding lipoprotein p37/Cypl n=1 Tax=Mycoplasma sp. 'Moose RK' TaxID=2780095 RepID=UPI0018C2C554|nr:DNA repair protein [Mycoplasma sp. 'Moose RK']MBG0730676.1 DNA repair protein [Mycoplasma sp. 'Moose RK']